MELSFDASAFDALSGELITEINQIKKIDGAHTRVGYTLESGMVETKDGKLISRQLTKVALAVIHEFGAGHIPSRPFMRQAFDNNINAIESVSANLHARYLNGEISKVVALRKLGEWFTGVIKDEILKGNFTPLKASTVKKKGSSKPLRDTDLNLFGGVDHKEVL